MYCFEVIEDLLDEEKNKKLVRLWRCYKEFHMFQLQGYRWDDVYAYEKRYTSFIVLSILNGSIISYMINILSHCPCKIGFLATDFLWLCSYCLGDDMSPYMHVQWDHALEMKQSILPYTLGQLRNEVMECKHREMKILNSNQGGG